MGEMLRETERAARGPDKGTSQRCQRVTSEPTPTLKALGLSKRESAEAQMLAEDFELLR